ncbi:hypothetical protein PoB_005811300 [Plakobranchus ocellatus]|uniref:Uncharacterized protein n=1 Tax=Plakobranchus ocellatus TaxID=259542 RepID=A0AAV4CJ11_9GAST|nr:hypothetical protein PoB_005811300 [Plakobranchus ocellatus]
MIGVGALLSGRLGHGRNPRQCFSGLDELQFLNNQNGFQISIFLWFVQLLMQFAVCMDYGTQESSDALLEARLLRGKFYVSLEDEECPTFLLATKQRGRLLLATTFHFSLLDQGSISIVERVRKNC